MDGETVRGIATVGGYVLALLVVLYMWRKKL